MAERKPAPQDDLKERQRYLQGYMQVVSNLYGRGRFSQEQARLAERAWKQKLPPSSFVNLIRKHDPAYPRSGEFRARMSDAQDAWSRHRPGRPMPHDFATNYVRSGLSKTQLLSRIEYGMKQKMTIPPAVTANHYRTLRSLLNDSYVRHTGAPAHQHVHDMVFNPDLTDIDIDNRLPELFGGKDAFRWMDPKSTIKTDVSLPGIDAER